MLYPLSYQGDLKAAECRFPKGIEEPRESTQLPSVCKDQPGRPLQAVYFTPTN